MTEARAVGIATGGKLVIPGGSGFLGTALARSFSRDGLEVVVLSRRAAPPVGSIRTVVWDGRTQGPWAGELDGADAVVNLAGRSVACIHNAKNREEITASRLDSVHAIEAAAARCSRPPPVLVQASAIGIYGDTGDRICDESEPAASDFIARVVTKWETAFFGGNAVLGQRRMALRIGFILGRDGGGMAPLTRLVRSYLGGAAGSGRQYLSWMHSDDFCAACRWLIGQPDAQGVYNLTGPAPATNSEFMRALRNTLGKPWSPPAPAWAVKLIARFVMKIEPSLALAGCRCVPQRLLAAGFVFRHPDLKSALRDLLTPAR